MINKPIRVCRIATVPIFFAAHLIPQIEYMQKKGMKVSIVSSLGEGIEAIEQCEGLIFENIEISRSLSIVRDIKALFKLIVFFRKNKFDIVHSTTPKAGLLSSISAFIARVPIRLHTWTGQPWVTLKGPMKTFAFLADKLIGFLNTKCYADSKSQRDFLIEKKVIPADKIDVIGYSSLAGVDRKRFSNQIISEKEKEDLREKLSIDSGATVFIFIGRITKDKGICELEQAFSKVLSSGFNVHLLLVGPFDDDCGGEKNIDISKFISNAKISYIGYTDKPENYFSISDILCLPSYREGFGTVVIEAASMGIPTIATNINGLVDAVDKDKTGVLVEPYSVESLYEAMIRFLEKPDMIKKMGSAAQERCRLNFDSEVINKKVFEEYALIMGK